MPETVTMPADVVMASDTGAAVNAPGPASPQRSASGLGELHSALAQVLLMKQLEIENTKYNRIQ